MIPHIFTKKEAISIQSMDLAEWRSKLTPEVYKALADHLDSTNNATHIGIKILRGSDIVDFVRYYKPLKTWRYTNSTEIIWTNFDCGEVQAYTEAEALEKALGKLKIDLEEANTALKPLGLSIDMNFNEIKVEDITHESKRD